MAVGLITGLVPQPVLDDDPWTSAVLGALADSGHLKGPGPSGLRPEHVRAALGAQPTGPALRRALADAVDATAAGVVPRSLRDVRAHALPKGQTREDGYRPIGVGDLLRQLTCRVALPVLASELIGPCERAGQLGASRRGTQRAAARVHAALTGGDVSAIAVDLRNAFNSISRRLLVSCLPRGSACAPLVRALYDMRGLTAATDGGATRFHVDRGVIQGCPLAALLFAHALTCLVDRAVGASAPDDRDADLPPPPPVGLVRPLPPAPLPAAAPGAPPPHLAHADGVRHVWYADDGTITVPGAAWDVADTFLTRLSAVLARGGLSVSPRKTTILPGAGACTDGDVSTVPSAWVRARCSVSPYLPCLGLPVANTSAGWSAVSAAMSAKVDEVARDVAAMSRLGHPLHVLRGLRLAGAWSRFEYYAAFLPESVITPRLLMRVEAADIAVLRGVLGVHGRALGPRSWLRASLPMRDGGLGIRRATAEAPGARAVAARELAAVEGFACLASPSDDGDERAPAEGGTRDRLRLWLDYSDAPVDRARTAILRTSRGLAASWLDDPPAGATWAPGRPGIPAVSPSETSTAVAVRLGLVVLPTPLGRPPLSCPGPCSTSGVLDPLGFHALGCSACATRRHNAVRDAVAHFFMALLPAGDVLVEQRCGPDGVPQRARGVRGEPVPGDVAIRLPGIRHWVYLDVVVASLRADQVDRVARGAGTAVHAGAWDAKQRDSPGAPLVHAARQEFLPIAASGFGSVDARSLSRLEELAAAAGSSRQLRGASAARIGAALGLGLALRRAIVRTVVAEGAAAVNRLHEAASCPPLPHRAASTVVAEACVLQRMADVWYDRASPPAA